MKQLKIVSLLAMIACSTLLLSCGGDSEGSPSNSIIGEWEFHDATGTVILNFPGATNSINSIKLINVGTTMTYRADSTFTSNNPNVPGSTESGKFKFIGDQIIHYDYTGGAFYWDGPIEITGNQFKAHITEEQVVANMILAGMPEEDAEDFYTTYDVTYVFKRK